MLYPFIALNSILLIKVIKYNIITTIDIFELFCYNKNKGSVFYELLF